MLLTHYWCSSPTVICRYYFCCLTFFQFSSLVITYILCFSRSLSTNIFIVELLNSSFDLGLFQFFAFWSGMLFLWEIQLYFARKLFNHSFSFSWRLGLVWVNPVYSSIQGRLSSICLWWSHYFLFLFLFLLP